MRARTAAWLLALAPAAAPVRQDGPPSVAAGVHPIEVRAEDGGEPEAVVEFVATGDGTLCLWVVSEAFDPLLTVGVDGMDPLEDDDGGGGTTPYAALDVTVGTRVRIAVGVGGPGVGAGGEARLHVEPCVDSEATRAAVELADGAAARAKALAEEGAVEAARELCASAIDGALATPELARSRRACAALEALGEAAATLGDLDSARRAFAVVAEGYARAYPSSHAASVHARRTHAQLLLETGHAEEAVGILEELLAVSERLHGPDAVEATIERYTLSRTMFQLGRPREAKALQLRCRDAFEAAVGPSHRYSRIARGALASTLLVLGELEEAKALSLALVAELAAELPPDHPSLQIAKIDLGEALRRSGDLYAARRLFEDVIDALEGQFPEEHRLLVLTRQNLGVTLSHLGDSVAARELFQRVLAVRERVLPAGHPDVLKARGNLFDLVQEEEGPGAVVAELDAVLRGFQEVLPPDHPLLEQSRRNLARALALVGRQEEALELQREGLAILDAGEAASPFARAQALHGVGASLAALGRTGEALRELARAREVATALPADHAIPLGIEIEWGRALELEGRSEELAEHVLRVAARERDAAVGVIASSAPREAEMWAAGAEPRRRRAAVLSWTGKLDVDGSRPDLVVAALELVETIRGAGLASSHLLARAARDPELDAARARWIEASRDLARVTTLGGGDVLETVRRRDRAQRAMLERLPGGRGSGAFDARRALDELADGQAAIAYWIHEPPGEEAAGPPTLLAFVLHPDRGVARLDLGPAAPVVALVEAWRDSVGGLGPTRGRTVGAGSAAALDAIGADLRARLFDPLAPHLEGAESLVVVPAGVLHLVPFDALPAGDGRLGDAHPIHVRSTLAELLARPEPLAREPSLLVLGGLDYAAIEAEREGVPTASVGAAAAAVESSNVMGAFLPLPGTGREAAAIAELFEAATGREASRLTGRGAGRSTLLARAPRAGVLHLATHGFFAPAGDRVTALSPLTLCGLALSGANTPADELGRLVGTITAEELAALDLTGCELAVLSACDTSFGDVRGAGQGVASLQKALRMAGARSVVTSLWQVPDAVTERLMVDFYRRHWVEGRPKARALWEAKQRIRGARDAAGEPLYDVRDWGGWVLTGEPD